MHVTTIRIFYIIISAHKQSSELYLNLFVRFIYISGNFSLVKVFASLICSTTTLKCLLRIIRQFVDLVSLPFVLHISLKVTRVHIITYLRAEKTACKSNNILKQLQTNEKRNTLARLRCCNFQVCSQLFTSL